MVYKVIASVQADADLDRLIDYLLQTLQNPVAAKNLLSGVEACYDHLSQMPYMYEQCRSPRLMARGYRKAVIHDYIMIYRVDDEENTVYVLRFFHGRQDYEKRL